MIIFIDPKSGPKLSDIVELWDTRWGKVLLIAFGIFWFGGCGWVVVDSIIRLVELYS